MVEMVMLELQPWSAVTVYSLHLLLPVKSLCCGGRRKLKALLWSRSILAVDDEDITFYWDLSIGYAEYVMSATAAACPWCFVNVSGSDACPRVSRDDRAFGFSSCPRHQLEVFVLLFFNLTELPNPWSRSFRSGITMMTLATVYLLSHISSNE